MEAHVSDELYIRFRDLLLARAGLHYPERKRGDLLHGLTMASQAAGYTNLTQLYADAVAGGPAWDLMVQHLTIGETYFFRNGPQFDALRQRILPDLLKQHTSTRSLRIWSAGCATGEEPYSLAMTVAELLRGDPTWSVSILATDINPAFLARAREGLYGEWSFRETSDEVRGRYWTKEQNRWRLNPEIRQMVSFSRLNLAEPCYPSIVNGTSAIDLLVCRNVTIYFDEATTRQVIDRFFRSLISGGWLLVGHAEPQASMYHQYEVQNFPNTIAYRKPSDTSAFAAEARRWPDSQRIPSSIAPRTRTGTSPLTQLPTSTAPRPRPGTTPLAQLPQFVAASVQVPAPPSQAATPSPAELVQLGRVCADRGDWAGAREHCDQALAGDSLCVAAHYLLGLIHEHHAAPEAALASYRRTVYLDRRFIPGLIGMGNVWRQLGRPRDARRSFEIALSYLAQSHSSAPVPGAEGATAGELTELLHNQLRLLR